MLFTNFFFQKLQPGVDSSKVFFRYISLFQILCLLDFYVHFAMQRKGHGKAIIDYMLQNEHAEPYQVSIYLLKSVIIHEIDLKQK